MKVTLSKINNILLALIILINAYVIIAPLLPALLFHADSRGGKQAQLQKLIRPPAAGAPAPVPAQPNRVVIPSMLLNQPVLEGTVANQYKVLNQGIWRWPRGSTPDKGGNTVLIGHRFTYTNPRGVFYFLNKIKLGDGIGVFWNNHQYLYQVTDISEVPPTDTAVENNTPGPELTLFTCTPLWLPKNRLVVVARLESAS